MNRNYFTLQSLSRILIGLVFLFLAASCEDEITDSLDKRIKKSNDPPVITSVVPAGKALSGVSEIVINGSNFSSIFEENFVSFGDGNIAEVLEASTNQLVVKAPLVTIPSDSDGVYADLRVAVVGSELPSAKMRYRLLEAVKELYIDVNAPIQYYGICVDGMGSIFASAYSLKPRVYKGEYKIPLGAEPFLFNKKGDVHFAGLKVGPDGKVLGVRADFVPGLYEIVEGQKPVLYKIITRDFQKQISDFDVDDQKRIWAGGKSDSLYSISYPDKKVANYPFEGKVNAVRIYKDAGQTYLYLSAVRNSVEGIYRLPINSDGTLGAEELYFDLSSIYSETTVTRAITFTTMGDLFVGNDGLYPVVIIHPDKTVENLYPELLKTDLFDSQNLDELISMTWGLEDDLYIVRRRTKELKQAKESFQDIVRILTGVTGAPYYGRN